MILFHLLLYSVRIIFFLCKTHILFLQLVLQKQVHNLTVCLHLANIECIWSGKNMFEHSNTTQLGRYLILFKCMIDLFQIRAREQQMRQKGRQMNLSAHSSTAYLIRDQTSSFNFQLDCITFASCFS